MNQEKVTILFVDDNKDFLTLAEEELESPDYEIKTILVASNDDLLGEVKAAKPSLIFLDVMFAKKFSNPLATQIRADEALRDIPIYLMSFLDLAEIEMIANKDEVNGCFMKPIKFIDVQFLLKKHFNMDVEGE